MKKEKAFVLLLVLALMAGFSTPVWADKGKNGPCKMCAMGKMNDKGGHGESTKDKFFDKAHFYLKNKSELALSEEQIKKIKELKLGLKKDLTMNDAEIKLAALDVKAKIEEDRIDTAAVNTLIDKKYELKRAAAKRTVTAYAELKTVLTDEQKMKAKEFQGKKHHSKKDDKQ
ncbi:MAG: hypothetical protein HY591_03350 [Candidatus Omnitrophica bacterium]|nr:hypothetical protein [Candidatus Omnitrophota bacterium]